MNTKKMIVMTAVLLSGLLISGCGSRAAIVKDYYLIDAMRPDSPPQTASEIILAVKPFTIGTGFQSRGLVYYVGDQKYESDFYHEYFVPPSQMVTELTQMWLNDSGLFQQVLAPASVIEPTHLLEADIRRLCYDVQDDEKLHAVLDVTFYLLQKKGRRIADIEFTKNYDTTAAFDKKNQQQAVNAMRTCMTEILTELEKDLATHLKNR